MPKFLKNFKHCIFSYADDFMDTFFFICTEIQILKMEKNEKWALFELYPHFEAET